MFSCKSYTKFFFCGLFSFKLLLLLGRNFAGEFHSKSTWPGEQKSSSDFTRVQVGPAISPRWTTEMWLFWKWLLEMKHCSQRTLDLLSDRTLTTKGFLRDTLKRVCRLYWNHLHSEFASKLITKKQQHIELNIKFWRVKDWNYIF